METRESLNISKIVKEIKNIASTSMNEEELKMGVEKLIDKEIFSKLKISPPHYEHPSRYRGKLIGRKDAVYGTVIIDYKSPGKLKSKSNIEKGIEQIIKYIEADAKKKENYSKYLGVLFDGFNLIFIRYRRKKWIKETNEVKEESILFFIEALRGLRRRSLDAESLLLDFGPRSSVSKEIVKIFFKYLIKSKKTRTEMLYKDWKRVFSQVCAYSPEKLKGLSKIYEINTKEIEKLLFAIHTYYTLLMKLITSEIVTFFTARIAGSYLEQLQSSYHKSSKEMLNKLKELEEGGIFRELGIRNFLEADYFSWYLDEWNEEIADAMIRIVNILLNYEPATVELQPDKLKDLFKRLYQNLVPRDVRHKLGEYFTPDWLAELVLDEVGYEGDPDKKLLDPSCGSGTFLVLAIRRIKEYSIEDKKTLLDKIIKNIRGIDLNPLAVLAAKANYIIAISDLLRYKPVGGIDIPIYLADSVALEKGRKWENLAAQEDLRLYTSEGEFWVPVEIIEKNLLDFTLSKIEKYVSTYSRREFENMIELQFKRIGKKISKHTISSIGRLFDKIKKLERQGKNRIWTSILRNSFAPLLIGKFDFVVGNPPWINWENLPQFYREITKDLWKKYGLTEKTKGMGLGKVKRDMAMLFVARCFDLYLKENGKLGFLIPFTAYKTQAGAGFRKWLAENTKIKKIHDLVTLYPFEGAVNRTSMVIIEKNGKTKFPVNCVMWSNPRSMGIEQEAELEEVKKTTRQFELIFIPVEKNKPESPWMEITEKAYEGIRKVFGKSQYRAHAGVYTGMNQVYWIEIISEQPNGLLITNPPLPGQKKKVKQVKQAVEKELVYPLIRGRDVKKWYVTRELGYILLPVDKNGKTLPHNKLKIEYPQTWKYFLNFVKDLVSRGGEPYKSKLRPYREKKFETAEKIALPFYWLFNVEPSLSRYKVVWKRIAGAITGKAVSFVSAVIEPMEDKFVDIKPVILNDSMILVPFKNRDEAYYLSGILNSSIALLAIASYTYELRQETHITQYIKLPKFDPKNPLHKKLSQLSQKAHEIAKKIYEEKREDSKKDLKKIEEEIDKTVAKLYGISNVELKKIKKALKILKGET